jgi:2-oxoglutarate ferredoxin oxidoreductase subunit gamma
MRTEIRISGIGGQGVVLAGLILGKAATVFLDYNAVHTDSYGPEARGGYVRSEVIISNEKIDYHHALHVDVLALLSEKSWDEQFIGVQRDALILYDPDLISKKPPFGNIHEIHAQKIAEELGNKIIMNIVMVGAITKVLKCIDEQAVRQAVLDTVPKAYQGLNIKAFEYGLKAESSELLGL